jgi:16S rRNA (guanine527-N7)-methyltransferase
VKHKELENELSAYVSLMGLRIEQTDLSLMARQIELVLQANTRVNLTRVVDPSASVRLLTADSLSALEDLCLAPAGEMLDLGTGAGFPGIPLAICSGRKTTLLDSVAKKVRELEAIVASLGLSDSIAAISSRAEALARVRPGGFAVVTARAVSELPALVELASPLLERGGLLVCLKGAPTSDERSRGEAAAEVAGMQLASVREFELPEAVGHRTIVCYRKESAGTIPLPRREGMAQHSPLA